jgi:hypothetical protein
MPQRGDARRCSKLLGHASAAMTLGKLAQMPQTLLSLGPPMLGPTVVEPCLSPRGRARSDSSP